MSFDSFIAQCVSDSINAAPAPEPKPPTLVEIVDAYMRQLEADEGECTLALEALDGAIDQKALDYKHIAIKLKGKRLAKLAECGPFQEIVDRLKRHASAIQKQEDDLHDRLLESMELTGKTKIVTVLGNLSVQSKPSTRIANEEEWLKTAPEQYVATKQEPKRALLLNDFNKAVKGYIALGKSPADARATAVAELPPGTEIIETKFLKGL